MRSGPVRAAVVAILATFQSAAPAAPLSARQRAELLDLQLAEATRVQRTIAGLSTEGAVVTAFRQWAGDGPILKIQLDVYGEVGRRSRAFYYDAGRPLYTMGAEWSYGMPIGSEGGGSDPVVTAAGGFELEDGSWEGWSVGRRESPVAHVSDAYPLALSLLRLMGAPGPTGPEACPWVCAEGALPSCSRFACEE